MKKRIFLMLVLLWVFTMGVPSQSVQAKDGQKNQEKRVLFISSYSYSWTSVPRQIEGLEEALGGNYILNYEFMDTKNTVYDDGYREFYNLLKFKLTKRDRYDAVVVGDDAALQFIKLYQDELFPDTPIVFEGIDNIEFAMEMAADPYVTGVVERVDYDTNLALAQKLMPKATKLVFILDNAENGVGIQKQLAKQDDLLSSFEVEYVNSSEYSKRELCEKIESFDESDIVFCISMSQSKNQSIYTEEERFRILENHSSVPMFRVSAAGVQKCSVLLGGYIVSHYQSGIIAGEMVNEALRQGNIADIEMDYNTPYEYYFDAAKMKKYDLDINQIPFEATLLNMEPNFFQKYYLYICVGGLFLIAILMIILIFTSRHNSTVYRRLNQQLEEKNQELIKTSAYKTDFLSNMSHEIRTPMNAIIGMTKLAEDVAQNEEAKTYLKEIDDSSQYMLGMLNDVLDMSRIDSGKFELNKTWISAGETFWACIHMMEPNMQAKNIKFIHPDTNKVSKLEFYIDGLRLKQVVMNLLNNAYKFTPSGGMITFTIKNIGYDEKTSTDQVMICDTGCGMSEEFLSRIFQPFEQERNVYTDQIQGTGLGLALVKKIVDAMGGTIEVDSELGKGSTFTFTFTYEYRIAEATHNEKEECSTEMQLAGTKILVVDDHPLNRRIASALLEKQGIIVYQAESGQIALDSIIKSAEIKYDAILMDIRMPGIDGLETTRRIRKLEIVNAKTVPIIAMTANAFEEDVRRSIKAGMNAHLAKPIEPEKMYQTLRQIISEG